MDYQKTFVTVKGKICLLRVTFADIYRIALFENKGAKNVPKSRGQNLFIACDIRRHLQALFENKGAKNVPKSRSPATKVFDNAVRWCKFLSTVGSSPIG